MADIAGAHELIIPENVVTINNMLKFLKLNLPKIYEAYKNNSDIIILHGRNTVTSEQYNAKIENDIIFLPLIAGG